MQRQRLISRGLGLAGLGIVGAVAARHTSQALTAADPYALALDTSAPAQYGAAYGGSPILYHRSRSISTLHRASYEAVREVLPSVDLHPVRMPGGDAVISISGMQHEEITANGVEGLAALPYGEVLVAAAVTRRPAPPFLPLVAPVWSGIAAGFFVLHLPVTTRVARDAGRLIWGYPKFVADIEFEESVDATRVQLSEGGRDILMLSAAPKGRPTIEQGRWVLYSVLGDELIEESMPIRGVVQNGRLGRLGHLQLGSHQVADELRALGISPHPFLATRLVAGRFAMTPGRPIGAARQYLGYIGAERDLGRYVVSYPHTPPIDRYATTSGDVQAVAEAEVPAHA
jgi:hypothetical protein